MGTDTTPLVNSESLGHEEATKHLIRLTQSQDRPAVLRVLRKRGLREALRTEGGRRQACRPFRVGEWAQIMGPPFDRGGISCIKIKYADPQSERVLSLADYVWETMGMDRVRLQYVSKSEDD
jgi:hypothetical protein